MLAERRITTELMDDPALAPETYSAVLADLAKVNTVTMAARPTLRFLDQAVGKCSQFTLLDVGYGQGDMLRKIAQWAQHRGIRARLIGIDLNPGSEMAARRMTDPEWPITYVTGDYADFTNERFDCVVSSLVAHHMTQDELLRFLRFMEARTERGWFVNDLHRHALSYLGYPILARIMGWHPIVRQDGQTSIARAFRPAEWRTLLAAAGIAQAQVQRVFPFRLCVSRVR